MQAAVKRLWNDRPLASIMTVAVVLRVVAAIFAKGYGMSDDHFCVIEPAQHWVDGARDWLGQSDSLRNLVYPGLHFLLFGALQKIGIFDPQVKMYVVRFLHAAFSLLTVWFGYKTVEAVSGRDAARSAGLLLAAFWLIPFMSVRNLIEFVCAPPLVIGCYYLYKDKPTLTGRSAFIAGIMFGTAFILRYQTAVVAATVGLVLLHSKKPKNAALFSAGLIAVAAILAGAVDWIAYGTPFSSFIAYVKYNSVSAEAYTVGPWYQYILLIVGILVPPTGLLLLWGLGTTWRTYALIFWPTLAFLVLHSIYPNKQERFILPVLPFVVMLCAAGWSDFQSRSRFWNGHPNIRRGLWGWFWAVNLVLLAAFTTTYSKKTRCESLSFLYHAGDATGAVLETGESEVPLPPLFYLGKRLPLCLQPGGRPADSLKAQIDTMRVKPNYLIMIGRSGFEERYRKMSSVFPKLVFVKEIPTSFLDNLLFRLNPRHNVNLACEVYRIDRKQ
jgi:hypothetical protein